MTKDSGEFMGGFLKKNQRKLIGGAILVFGFLLALPPFVPSPDDFINFIIAQWLSLNFSIPLFTALLYTYTIIAWSIIALGIVVYPERDGVLITKLNRKIKRYIRDQLRKMNADMGYTVLVILLMLVTIMLYMRVLSGMI